MSLRDLRGEFSSPAQRIQISSLEDLNAHLEQLAAALGIDTSDIDDNEPVPPKFLAMLPPELAAFLADPPDPTESPPVAPAA